MAFTIYGPGIRDNISLDNLFRDPEVEEPDAITPARSVDEKEGQNQGRRARQQLARTYANKAYQTTTNIRREREPLIRASQLMSSPVITVLPETSIVHAWKLFREKRFRHVPVIDGMGQVVGILSDRSLLRYAATTGNIPPYEDNSEQARTSIEPMMISRVVTATPDTEIRQIARLLFEKRIGAMPIVDYAGNLVGIITRSDILRTLVNNAPLELWV